MQEHIKIAEETTDRNLRKTGVENAGNAALHMLLEIKDFSVILLDAAGYVISWNEGAAHIYGYRIEETIGKHISVFYRPADAKKGEPGNHLRLAACNGRHEYETLERRKDGTEFYTRIILSASHDDDKNVNGFAKITRDIDVQKKLEIANQELHSQLEEKVKQRTKELMVVNKELEAFSYSVSHDLRVPLRAISGYSNLLKNKYQAELDEEGNRIIDVIVDKTRMMGLLIDDLLAFSKMARLHILSQRIDMKKMAEVCILQLLQDEIQKEYKVIINEMPVCSGDESMLKQVWCNLLSNAIKYSSKTDNPSIIVGSKDDENMNIYFVKDNGVGFEMKYANNLFGVFQRLHRQDEFEGTGIGLALTKRIVTKHGGEIWAEAKLNEGATFYFSIPKTYK